MTALVAPIHTGRLNGQPVRFFKGPSGGPELPWHAVEDLYRALGLPQFGAGSSFNSIEIGELPEGKGFDAAKLVKTGVNPP